MAVTRRNVRFGKHKTGKFHGKHGQVNEIWVVRGATIKIDADNPDSYEYEKISTGMKRSIVPGENIHNAFRDLYNEVNTHLGNMIEAGEIRRSALQMQESLLHSKNRRRFGL
jgi:hypothetical protein